MAKVPEHLHYQDEDQNLPSIPNSIPISIPPNNPIHHPRHMRIICVGAGLAGICFAYKLQRSFEDFSLTVYEKNEDIAGVWFENRYPGVACDFPAHNYTYTFEPKVDFPSVYADGSHVRQYLVDFSSKYGLGRYYKTRHEVTRAVWDTDKSEWRVQVRETINGNVIEDVCDILVNAGGPLNAWRWPDLVGLKDFQGPLLHSARWDENLTVAGKRIGIIGNGSSGQQLVEAIQPAADRLITFIRQPNWIVGAFGDPPRAYTKEELDDFKAKPGHLLQKRKQFERVVNSYFTNFLKDGESQAQIRAYLTEEMKKKLAPLELQRLLIPNYGVGCRRPTPGVGYLEALTAKNTEVVVGEIQKVIATGVVDSTGKEHALDILVCATGFDTSYRPRFPLIGWTGRNVQDEWAKSSKAYLATAIPDVPNYFMFFGPNNPFGSGSYVSAVECQTDYMLKFCDRWQTENIRSFAPKIEAVEDFLAYTKEFMKMTVWTDTCRSWYKKGTADDNALSLWPGSGLHFREALSDIRADDWNITYIGNRFSWLGNGFSQVESDRTCDLAYYIREHDDGPALSRRKHIKILAQDKEHVDDGLDAEERSRLKGSH